MRHIVQPFPPLLCLLLAACSTAGVIQGRSAGQAVQLHYQHSFWDQNGVISTVMPDGERFSGKFVVGKSIGLGLGTSADGPALVATTGNTSDAAAVLMGDRGGSMHCRFQLQRPSGGIEAGGVGHCRLADGQVIDATF